MNRKLSCSSKKTESYKDCQDEKTNLFSYFGNVKDFRRAQGKVHDLPVILIIMTMAIMSGYYGQRAIGDFIKRNQDTLLDIIRPKKDKLPSYQTVARVVSNIDFKELFDMFYQWSQQYVQIDKGDILIVDGKVIGGTVINPHNQYQEYINLVSVFSAKRKQVIALEQVPGKESEIPAMRQLVKQLDIEGIIFSADALHCQKKTMKAIIQSKNDYIIGVKLNQRNLYNQLKKTVKITIQ